MYTKKISRDNIQVVELYDLSKCCKLVPWLTLSYCCFCSRYLDLCWCPGMLLVF